MKTIKEIDNNVLVLYEILRIISSNYYFNATINDKLKDFLGFLYNFLYTDNIPNDIIDNQLFNIITYLEEE